MYIFPHASSGRASGAICQVYDVAQGQDLPEEKIWDKSLKSSQLVAGAWVRFTSPLPRADDAFGSDPWIRRHSGDAQSQSAMAGGDARVDGTRVLSHCDAIKAAVVGRQHYKGTAVKWPTAST